MERSETPQNKGEAELRMIEYFISQIYIEREKLETTHYKLLYGEKALIEIADNMLKLEEHYKECLKKLRILYAPN